MMSRRARPSARTNKTAPTAPCVPVDRDGAPVPRSIPTEAGPVTGNGSCTSVEGGSERSTGSPGGPHRSPQCRIRGRLAFWRSPSGSGWPWSRSAIYLATRTDRFYDHFVWQAAAFLEGHAAIRYPVLGTWRVAAGTPTSRTSCRSPRRTAWPAGCCRSRRSRPLLLLPFVAVWGLATNDQPPLHDPGRGGRRDLLVDARAARTSACRSALATTLFFAFGTVFWYTAQLATTWYQAHIVAVGLTMLACGLAIGADPAADDDEPRPTPPRRRRPRSTRGRLSRGAATARWPASCSAWRARPASRSSSPPRSSCSSARAGARGGEAGRPALGAAIPIGLLLAYNLVTAGQVVHPAYDYLYRIETAGYPSLGYRPDWAIEDPRYLPQNLGIMLFLPPDVLPDRLPDALGYFDTPVCTEPGATRGLFDPACPLAVPSDVGMSVLLTSPAFLLALGRAGPVRAEPPRDRIGPRDRSSSPCST